MCKQKATSELPLDNDEIETFFLFRQKKRENMKKVQTGFTFTGFYIVEGMYPDCHDDLR